MSNNFGCSCGNHWRNHEHTPCQSCHNDRDRRDDWRDDHRNDRHDWHDHRDDRHDNRRDDWRDDRRNNRCNWCGRNSFWPWR